MTAVARIPYETSFVRVSNEKIRSLTLSDSVCGIRSLRELGLYSLLSAILSNPSFETANGGLQSLLLRHCKNRYYSLHGSWKQLISLGLLKRTRISIGHNCFRDYYDLLHAPDMSLSSVTYLSADTGRLFAKSRHPFIPPEQDFTIVSYSMLMDPRLSLSAKGLYALIARKLRIAQCIPGEAFTKDILFRSCTEGRNAFDALWRELRECGYLILTRVWDPVRKKSRFLYTLNSAAKKEPESENNEFPVHNNNSSPESVPMISSVPAKENYNFTLSEIRDQIDYISVTESFPREKADLIVSILAEQYRYAAESPGKTIHIGGDTVPILNIARNLRSLRGDEICYVLDTYSQVSQKSRIHNSRKYLLSCLYHAESDYQAHLETALSMIGIP